jgi:hypothetical protein
LVLVSACNNSKKTKQLLGFKKPREKNPPKQDSLELGFLCIEWGGESRKPTKNQGEIQGGRQPSVLVGFLRQKKDCAYTLWIGRVLGMRWPASMSPLRLDVEMFNFISFFSFVKRKHFWIILPKI